MADLPHPPAPSPAPQPLDYERLRAIPPALLEKLAADKPSTSALEALRKLLPGMALFALGADLARARRKLRNKMLHPEQSFADIPRAEMATARPVALYRMGRLLQAATAATPEPRPKIFDLGCGVGGDFCALIELARQFRISSADLAAYERDPFAAWSARANLQLIAPDFPAASLRGDDLATLSGAQAGACLFLDPTRRSQSTAGRRHVNAWEQCEPPGSVWLPWVARGVPVAIKVAPAFDWRGYRPPPQTPPPQFEAIEWHSEVHELALWWNFSSAGGGPAMANPAAQSLAVTREITTTRLSERLPAGAFAGGRRATLVFGEAQDSAAAITAESLFQADGQDSATLRAMEYLDRMPAPGDPVAIPAPAVMRLDLVPALAHAWSKPLWAGQPMLIAAPHNPERPSRLAKFGTVVEVVAAREKELRRAFKSGLARQRWQPQLLGLGDADKLIRQLEQEFARAKGIPPTGIALVTRIGKSHVVLFLKTAATTKIEEPK